MKKWRLIFFAVLLVVVFLAYGYRTGIRDAWSALNAPKLPTASKFVSSAPAINILPEESPIEGGVATSENFILVSSPSAEPPKTNPFQDIKALPDEVNLDVPFTTQAPYADWSMPYQEACEEASIIMIHEFYQGKSGVLPAGYAKQAIDDLVAYENETLGYYKDTDYKDIIKILEGKYGYGEVYVKPVNTADDIKRVLANGYPVLLPAAGKLLKNPNFKNGGPLYHMLVVKGYINGKFITNDPGTRKGADYLYSPDILLEATHDWNGGNVLKGEKVMIVIMPKNEQL